MGTFTDSSSDSELFVDGNIVARITPEDIHKVLLEGYNIITDRAHRQFECREKDVFCLWRRYRCLFNPYFPQFFKFVKDPLGFEYLILIATVGEFAIDVVLYWDNFGWIVLNEGVCHRRYNFGGCSKLQYSVAKRKPVFLVEDKCLFDARKTQIDTIIGSQDYAFGPNTYIDWRFKPQIQILEPCKGSKVTHCEVKLSVCIKNWKLEECGKSYHVYLDGCYVKTVHSFEPQVISLHDKKKGWHHIEVKLFDECCRYARVGSSTKFYLCADCKCNSSSSSSSSSGCSSSSSSSSCTSSSSTKEDPCLKKHFGFGKGCKKSSSSSSSSSCSSSSSSSDCSSSSSTVWKCKKKCSSSSSSSSCSSSSSSSSDCYDSSSSSGCSSSSSSTEWICKKKSSSSCPSSSSTTTCPSSSSQSADFYQYQQSFSCPSSCSDSSSSSVDCNPCNGKVYCPKRKTFKCADQKCDGRLKH